MIGYVRDILILEGSCRFHPALIDGIRVHQHYVRLSALADELLQWGLSFTLTESMPMCLVFQVEAWWWQDIKLVYLVK